MYTCTYSSEAWLAPWPRPPAWNHTSRAHLGFFSPPDCDLKGRRKVLLRDHGEVKGKDVHVLRALAALRRHGDSVRRRAREADVSERRVHARSCGRGLRQMFADRTVSDDVLFSLFRF